MENTLIIDSGTLNTKYGYNCLPPLIIPSAIEVSDPDSYSKFKFKLPTHHHKHLVSILNRVSLKSTDSFDKYIELLLDNAKYNSEPIIFALNPIFPLNDIAYIEELLFEKYTASRVHCANSLHLCMNSIGKTSALVLDLGHGSTKGMSFFEGYPINSSHIISLIGGKDIQENALNSLIAQQINLDMDKYTASVQKLLTSNINFSETPNKESYVYMPDNNILKIPNSIQKCGEIIFDPFKHHRNENIGVIEGIKQITHKSPIDVRKALLSTVFITGGVSIYKGIATRIHNDLTALGLLNHVEQSQGGLIDNWNGAKTMSEVSSFISIMKSRECYLERK